MAKSSKRIAKNTLILYLRMLVTITLSLYTVRVVLDVLGIQDYGIFHVVGGLVALFSFLPGAMASATQRYFAHALGEGNHNKLKKVFVVNAIVYSGIGVLAFAVLETAGLWFVHNHLNIPTDRADAATVIYHLSVVSFLFSILTTPCRAIIIAHEDMKNYAFIEIAEAALKLGLVLLLSVLQGDKLIQYGVLMLLVVVASSLAYLSICFRKYPECRFSISNWDPFLAKEILGFTGWTLLGQLTSVARMQAVTILLNQSFGPVVAAARVIAFNVASKANLLSQNFNTGLYSPIIKAYASRDMDEMYSLIVNGAKITFFLMWILALPLLVEMEGILYLWLKEVPEEAILFARLALIEALISAVSIPLATAARAPGKMALYESILGSIQLGIFLGAWIVLWNGLPAYSVYLVAIAANVLMFFVRLILVKKLVGVPIAFFLLKVFQPVVCVAVVSYACAIGVQRIRPEGFVAFTGAIALTIFMALLAIYLVGIDSHTRLRIKQVLRSRLEALHFA